MMAIKRGKGQLLIPLEELSPNERTEIELTGPLTAEQIYERRWASTVLARVLDLLKNEYGAAGNARLFDSLKQLLPNEPGAPTQADIAAQLDMSANAVCRRFIAFVIAINHYCERKSLTPLLRPATLKTSCVI